MPSGINPYVHTTSVLNPHTVNKYVHSVDSMTDLTKIPSLDFRQSYSSESTSPKKTERDNETINKRLLTSDSLFDLHSIPCPFNGKGPVDVTSASPETINKRLLSVESQTDIHRIPSQFEQRMEPAEDQRARRRRHMSPESRRDLECIPDPFAQYEGRHHAHPSLARSHYAFGPPEVHNVRSSYIMDHQRPYIQARAPSPGPASFKENHHRASYCHSPRPTADFRPTYTLPSSAYDYTPYGHPHRTHPTQSDYDYTFYYSQPMAPPYYPHAPFVPSHHARPYYYHQPPPTSYHHHPHIPMYNLGVPYYLHPPMSMPFSEQSSGFSRVDTEMENMRIPDQFCAYPQHVRLRRPVTPNNETINKHARDVDSLTDLHKLDVHFGADKAYTYDFSREGSQDGYRLRDFSVDSMRDLRALPSFSSISLPNEPSRNVLTARVPSLSAQQY